MKKLIITLLIISALGACQEHDDPILNVFVGSWRYSNNEIPIDIRFDVLSNRGILNYTNRAVVHPAIPEDQQHNNNLRVFDEFKNGDGYGKIEITSRGPFYYKVTLIYNRITGEEMLVYDVQIDIPSEPFIVLTDQVFTK